MNTKAMINKGRIRHSATLNVSQPQKLNSTELVQTEEKIYPRRIKTTIVVESETVENLRLLADRYCTGVNNLITEAIHTANLEILETRFEGLSEEEFLDKFPLLPSAECKGQKLLCKLPATTRLCAELFAVASDQSLNSYINTAICKAMQNFSLSRLKDFQRRRYR